MPKEISSILNIFILPICLILLVSNTLFACTASFNFCYPEDMITDISIVALSWDQEGELQIEELKKVDNINEFIKDFKEVEASRRINGGPLGAADDDDNNNAIMICYSNGEYELIGRIGQSTYRNDRGLVYYDGYFSFDRDQFNALIEKYLSE